MFGARLAQASEPVGVWVKVQAVQYEPNAAAPTRIRITGAAMLYDGNNTNLYVGYTAPARGALYYECPADQLATCIDEWKDIVANISEAPEVCVGIGHQSKPTGRLRPLGDVSAPADVYPIQLGVVHGFSPCQVLRDFLSGDAGVGAGGTGAGGDAGAGGAGGTASAGTGGASGTGGGAGVGAGGSPPGSGGSGSSSGGAGGKGSVADASTGTGGAPVAAAPRETESSGGCSVGTIRSGAASGIGLVLMTLLRLRRRRS